MELAFFAPRFKCVLLLTRRRFNGDLLLLNKTLKYCLIFSHKRRLSQCVPSHAINYWRTVLKESDDLDILGVTFDPKLTCWEASSLGFQSSFSKILYLVEVPLSIPWLIASWEMLSGFCPAFLDYCAVCSAVRCSAADTHLKLLDHVVSCVQLGVCLNVTLHIVDLWQYYIHML